MPTRLKPLVIALWLLVALAGAAVLWLRVIEPRLNASVGDTLGQGDYELVTTDGQPFTADTLKGTPSAVFFGFTHCPDVCPTTMGDAMAWQEAMAAEGEELRVFLITVDPERDTPDVMRDYVSYTPGVIGVTGSPDQVAAAIDAFRIYARKVPTEGDDYTMDHSALTLLFDEDGRLFEPIGYGEGIERATDKLRRLFAS
ncbi:SCO family protein [Maribius pontilimi]|uniref:SCO family protein n=1 Tax=Palleronia pontilimi TaxID=1964209 RepID=A0A934MDI3_9RHOB|nr:SCO family protein [Palleronia pontilimi]MBJ3762406.1 SCO family protein [Palleronia pontilimi]